MGVGMMPPPGGMPPAAMGAPFPGDEDEDPAAALQPPPGFAPGEIEEGLDLSVRLDEDERNRLGQQMTQELAYFEQCVADRRENAVVWRDQAQMMPNYPLTDTRNDPGSTDWMARAQSLLTSVACRSAAQKLMQQIVLPQPPFIAEPQEVLADINGQEVDLVQRAPDVEDAWENRLGKCGWRQAMTELFEELTVVCPCAVRVEWEKEEISYPERTVQQDDETFTALLETGSDPQEALMESISTDAAGRPKVRPKFVKKTVREGAFFSVIPFERLVFLPGSAYHVADTFAIGEYKRVRACDLRECAKDRRHGYYREAVEHLLDQPSDSVDETERVRQDRAAISADLPTVDDDPEYREWNCVRLSLRGRLGREKDEKWYWLLVHPGTQTVLQCCYQLDRHGACPYTVFNYFGQRMVGMSVAELNATSQEAHTMLLNAALDLTFIMVCAGGSFFYEKGSGYNPNMGTIAPGRQIPVLSVQGIKRFEIADNIPQALAALYEAANGWREMSQTLTSTSNISLGKEAQGDKTLGEIELVFNQDQAISEVIGYSVALSVQTLMEKWRQVDAQYAPTAEVSYLKQAPQVGMDGAVTNAWQQKKIEPELLGSDGYCIVPAGLTSSSSGQARYQKAFMALQTVMANPMMASVPEIMFDATESVLQALGVGNASLWVSRAKQAFAEQQMVAAQQAQAKAGMLAEGVTAAEEERKSAKPGKDGKMPPLPPGPTMMDAIGAVSGGGQNGGGP